MNPRLPAEWEAQDGVLLAWPHEGTDWAYMLGDVRPVFVEIIRQITRFERVVLTSPRTAETQAYLAEQGIDTRLVTICEMPNNDTWARDFGPITVEYNGQPVLLDFAFNGWGLKFPANHDNLITRQLKQQGVLAPGLKTIGLVMEGGSIESDGLGTILTTAACLMSGNRNPQLDQNEIEQALASLLGARRVHWLNHGFLAGDDTDSHIDTLARICPDNVIVYQACDDERDEHYRELKLMEQELSAFKAPDGSPYRLIPLPWPKARFDEDAHRLPATYANFLVINGAVLVPTYRDEAKDHLALERIGQVFPGREIIGIDCLPLVEQHGSLHCVTMQLPRGVLS
ncbi:agmatine/peptidylarginine deiminase [Geobacter sp. SVR]|uniref:agmatine deiminase family protein n=1 Tax=Geobacter sp. SVR TaxID=2495594 RepID=UPI00143EFCDE|nr:agmatine deiminase family protein [Geobacter sp. SVR]BCS53142.1 agmatine deiminase [Geobacter sp. SVR]GCF84527.1 agmatine deiminase [Geobacter sp. SVR]